VSETVIVVLIAGTTSVTGPVILAWLTGRQRHKEKVEDWTRQDAIASKQQSAADLVALQAQEAAALLLASNKKVATAAAQAATSHDEKLEDLAVGQAAIHTLVNSQMTDALQSQLEAKRESLAALLEIIDLKKAAGQEPTPEALAAVDAIQVKVGELEHNLADRHTQAEVVVAQEQAASSAAAPLSPSSSP
jgi:hypothetical protein